MWISLRTKIKNWFYKDQLNVDQERILRSVIVLQKRHKVLQDTYEKMLRTFASQERRNEQTESNFKKTRLENDELRLTVKRQEQDMDALREQIKILEDLTIPALVNSHQLIIKRLEAQIAVESAKEAIANGHRTSTGET